MPETTEEKVPFEVPAPKLVPPGTYLGKVSQWGFGETEKKGSPYFYFVVRFHSAEDEADGRAVPLDKAGLRPFKRNINFWLTKADMVKKLAGDMNSLGYDRSDMKALDPQAPEAFDFTGVEVAAACSHQEYEGKTRESWWFERRGRRISQEEVGNITDRFGDLFQSSMSAKLGLEPQEA